MHNTETLPVTDNGIGDHHHNNHHQYQPSLGHHQANKVDSHKSVCVKPSSQLSSPSTPTSIIPSNVCTSSSSATLPTSSAGLPTVLSNQNTALLLSVGANGNSNNNLNSCSGVRECAGCCKRITERFLLKALDLYWHEDCLKCGCCDCRLGEVGSTLYTKANLILCKRDYLRLFGNTGLCAACTKVIPAFEMVMRAKSNVYHLECFACQQCNHRFCVGDRFYLCENKILCEYDYEERLVFANMAYNPSSLAHIRRQVSSLQPAGDSCMNKRNGENIGIGYGSNGGRSNGASNFGDKDQQHQHQHRQHHNYNVNQLLHVQNQQHQTQQQNHRDSGYGSSPDSETKITEFDSHVH